MFHYIVAVLSVIVFMAVRSIEVQMLAAGLFLVSATLFLYEFLKGERTRSGNRSE
ncbi:MAG: hypothetical protein IMW86_01615 [Hydrogenibacillus sp.]|nr:hypothetical protein [Hydrogenibacillus sp.]